MGRLSKAVLLTLLLVLSGVPGAALHLCAQGIGSHAHACCMAHKQVSASSSGRLATQVENTSCCKVAPLQSTPIQLISPSSALQYTAHAFQATSDGVFVLPVPTSGTASSE